MPLRRIFSFCLFAFGLLLAGSAVGQAQKVPLAKLPHLQKYLNSKSDTTYVINFWATWCKPCIEELPSFEALQKQYAGKPVQVVLVSMDFAKDLEKKVVPFVSRHKLQSKVFLLDEPDQNAWIDIVDPSWSGAIPATLLVNNSRKQRIFLEKPITLAQLQDFMTSKFSLNP
ncbi:TlpA disulfide reductase family protein [Rufibacter latericius]|uniref:TlpA family protein disulfide reductase n=1 Tax=Rufibacter latericius TaxID=2487040 RepID=A0A3M9MKI2_9BACT|nr:TlpA disulfide reductase family protein [Rufibacter latericius]RNI25989.1 TlpA family protein disulfide reductase [Rufibacter latericius]